MYEHVPLGLTPGSGNAGGVSSMVRSEVHSELFRKRSQAISLLAAGLHFSSPVKLHRMKRAGDSREDGDVLKRCLGRARNQ